MADLVIDTNIQSKDLFNKCQRTVSKVVTERYSSSQRNLMMRVTKYGEPIADNDGLSPCIATENVSDMYKTLFGKNKPDTLLQASCSATSQEPTEENLAIKPKASDLPQEIKDYLKVFCKSNLPPVQPGYEYNHPYDIAKFLANLELTYKHKQYCISLYTIIMYLINTKLFPVQKTTLYIIIDMLLAKTLHHDCKWSLISTPGSKPLLLIDGFNYSVAYVQEKTLGGFSFPISEIKTLVKDRIDFE